MARRGAAKSVDTNEALFLKLKEWVLADIEHSQNWRAKAKEEFAFVAGPGQWAPEEVQALKDQMRPVVTFNKTLKFVRSVCGIEANNRQMTTFLPRDVTNAGEVKANELLSNASDWMDQGCKAGKQQSRAFRDAVICGMGWTEGALDYDEDPKGKYIETRVNPLEMGWDHCARDQNLQDSKRRWRVRKMLVSEARKLIPGVTDNEEQFTDADLDATWASDVSDLRTGDAVKTLREKEERNENIEAQGDRKEVHIVQVQWWEHEDYIKTIKLRPGQDEMGMPTMAPAMGQDGKPEMIDVSNEEYARQSAEFEAMYGQPLPKAVLRRKVYKQAFVGSRVLQSGNSPRVDGFTFNCITWEPDDNDGTWFGITRVLSDPQRWGNKFFSQLMHIINSTAKGGIMAEADAFEDVQEAQLSYAKPNAITVVAKGAISKGKIMAKPGAQMTSGVLSLLQITDAMFSETTGMNMELMGLADRQQPGVLEAQRKQAAMTILATLFDSMGSFRQDVGLMRLHFIQNYLADGRLIRIHGDDGAEAIPLIKDLTLGRYDVIVDDAPTSPNAKERTWAALQSILPAVQDRMTDEAIVMLLDYVPGVPSKLVQAFKDMLSKEPDPAQAEAQQRGAMAEIENKEADTANKKASAVLNFAKAAAEKAKADAQAVEQALSSLGMRPPPAPVNEDAFQSTTGGFPAIRELQEIGMVDADPMQPAPGNVQLPGGLNPRTLN